MSSQTPAPKITVAPPPPGGVGAGTPASGSTGSKDKPEGILWIEELRTPMGYQAPGYKSKTEAKAMVLAGTLTPLQQSILQRGYAAYVAGGGKKKLDGWFSTMVDASTAERSPFQNIIEEYDLTGGSYSTVGDQTTILTPGANELGTGTPDARLAELKKIKAALALDPNALLTGDAGKIQDSLLTYADAMGLMKSTKEINSFIKNIYENKTTADDIANDMRKQATILYANFADRLNSNPELTVRDLVNPYLQVMADTLEIDPNMVKLTDPTIQNAISGTKLRSLTEFRNDMRADSRFAATRTAKKEAADFAQSLLKGFGFSI
jgi:hypothetical protein